MNKTILDFEHWSFRLDPVTANTLMTTMCVIGFK